ncbi:ATP-binding protein [Bernardetia sp. Wsw4-3y2]|uniref:ATP-binding protein n=1 Tax=Bernardetia sp. Wsw4-3y2 TaxID=3127471 RepID=UPI0030D01C40
MQDKIKILIVTSDPVNLSDSKIRTEKFLSAIQNGLSRAEKSSLFEIETAMASSFSNFAEAVEKFKPDILHLVGHGSKLSFVFEEDKEEAENISYKNLTKFLHQYYLNIKIVILSACDSLDFAQKITEKIDYAIGFNGFLKIEDAILYTEKMYFYLASENTVIQSSQKTESFLKTKGIAHIQELVQRNGADPYSIYSTSKAIKHTKYCLASLPTQDIFEGREKELQKLNENLFENHHTHVVSVKGIGGVGKSALVREYFIRKHTDFDFAIFLEGQIDIFSTLQHYALLDNLELTKKIDSIPKNKDQNKNILELIENTLLNLQTDDKKEQATKLLVIDDVPTNDTQILNRLVKGGWLVITTSRENIRNTSTYELFELTPEDAQHIFARYYSDKEVIQSSSEDTEIIEKIVSRLNYHVLAIELVAKNTNYLGWDLEKLNQILADKGLDISPYADIEIQHNKQKNIEHLFSYLLEIFPLDGLDKDEIYLLQQYSVIPDEIIDSLLWESLLGETSDYWQHISQKLHKKGWLNMASTSKENGFRLHALLAEIVRNKASADINTMINVTIMIEGLHKVISKTNSYLHQSKEVYQIYLPIVKKLKTILGDTVILSDNSVHKIIDIYRDIGWLLKNREYHKLSLEYLDLALGMSEQIGEVKVAEVKAALCDAFRVYYKKQPLKNEQDKLNALKYAEEAYEYFKKESIIHNMHNVGVTLSMCIVDFDKSRINYAEKILVEAIEDAKIKSKWELVAQGIANMGYLLYYKGKPTVLVIEKYEEALKIYDLNKNKTKDIHKIDLKTVEGWHLSLKKLYGDLDNMSKSNYHKNEAEKIEQGLEKGDS